MRGGSAFWTEERVEKLRKLVAEGHSASVMATILGHASRSAIIGKVHRLGLAFPNSTPKRKRTKAKVIRRAPVQPQKISPLRRALEMAPEPMPETEPELVIPIAERKTLLELEKFDCRWPINHVGEPDFHFCGRKQVVGTPYCDFHLRRAYQPPSLPRRQFVPFVVPRRKVKEDA